MATAHLEPPAEQGLPVPTRLSCSVEAGITFEAEVGEIFETGVFVPTRRADLQYTGSVNVTFDTGAHPQLSFRGQIVTWVRGRGVRIEAQADTPKDTLRALASWSRGRPAVFSMPAAEPAAPARVLLVDDDRNLLRMLRRRLAKAGCEVDIVDEPEEALEVVRAREFDAVLMDWILPKIPGQDLLRGLLERVPDVPVAVMSGSLIWDDAEGSLLRAGASEVFAKPVDLARLLDWLGGVRRPQAASSVSSTPRTVPNRSRSSSSSSLPSMASRPI